ncbi:MAG: quinone-interacting membrane-bound oxidoreductase complex subunit QmoC [Candidatus Methylomirabilia bacterium]
MSEAQLIKPDLGYVKEVIAAGGESLKKCYQCATCTVVCDVTADAQPFPRKEMVWAQWGLKERLINDADVWLCHQCADCTARCPRDAKPGEVLGAIRRTAYRAHAVPAVMGTLFSDIKYLPVVFAIPVLVLAAMIMLNNQPQVGSHIFPLWGGQGFMPTGEIVFSKMMPITTGIDATFLTVAFLAVLSAFASLKGFWGRLEAQVPASVPRKGFGPSAAEFLGELVSHASFKKCTVNAGRTLAHLLVFYGFVGAFIATNIVLVYEWGTKFGIFHELETPLAFSGAGLLPKLFGNIGGLAIVFGALLMIGNRMSKSEESPASGYDWIFLFSIFLVGATGMLTEILRLMDNAALAYPMYFVHLVFVFYVIAFFPYSKLAHLLYRPIAIIHAKNVGRDTAAPAAKAA